MRESWAPGPLSTGQLRGPPEDERAVLQSPMRRRVRGEASGEPSLEKNITKGNLIWRSKQSQWVHSHHQGSWGATGCLLNVTSPPLVSSSRSRMESHNACLNLQLPRDLPQTGASSSISYPAVCQGQLNPGLRQPCHLALCTNKNSLELGAWSTGSLAFSSGIPGAAWSANGHSGR